MSWHLVISPWPIAAVTPAGGTGGAMLLTPDPRETWAAADAAATSIVADLGQARSVDSIFLGFTNAGAAMSWTIEASAAPGGPWTLIQAAAPLRAADSLGPFHHGYAYLPAAQSWRYWRLSLSASGGAPLEAGVLMLGEAFAKPREVGGGRTLIDTGTRTDLVSGGFGMGGGTMKASFNWSYVDLTDAELRRLWAIGWDRGTRRPVLVVEDADLTAGRNEAMHYGVFDRFQAYERREADNTRWALSMVEWT